MQDAGRGWRKVVASPIPVRIQELDLIKTLSDTGAIVIAIGGGGIPVIEEDNMLKGVCINFKQPNETKLDSMTTAEAKQYIDEKQFAPGSMLPKVQACIKYVEETGHPALITSLEKAKDGLAGLTGTSITKQVIR